MFACIVSITTFVQRLQTLTKNDMKTAIKSPILLKVKVDFNDFWFHGSYFATDQNYEPGYPLGSGKTIQEAIEDYLEKAYEFYIEKWHHSTFTYTWSWFV